MFDFKPLYAPLPDSKRYLERIGISSIDGPDKETLDRLVLCHQRTVPFENLDIYDADAYISLGIPELYDKIVLRRRGGYCFELNAAFMGLLISLGYDCYALAVRVVWNFPDVMPISHRATVVTIDGVRYFCDVGFGGPSPQNALYLDVTGFQESGANIFEIEKGKSGTTIHRIVNGKRERLLLFSEEPCDPVDFLALSEYQSRGRDSMFRKGRLLNLVTETGSITLTGNVLKIHDDGNTSEKTLSDEQEIKASMEKNFGLSVDFPLKAID
ncbi:MAG: arylamine N-acetyltransferase [Acidobacteriota bacterium]|jgi:N-hydroxyarylamine O-acetyltransferase|nr:arylamine N-acetyltransferase [Acidobacteriota bacterium]